MKLPNGEFLGRIPSRYVPTIAEAFGSQLIVVFMKDGTKGVYDGEHNMELTTSYRNIYSVYSSKLTKLLQDNFPNIKEVHIADF